MSFSAYKYLGQTRRGHTYKDYRGTYGLTGEKAQFSYIDYSRKYSTMYREA